MVVAVVDAAEVAADAAGIVVEIAATVATAGKHWIGTWERSAASYSGRVTPSKKFEAVVLCRGTGSRGLLPLFARAV
jgi:hypothetical protein